MSKNIAIVVLIAALAFIGDRGMRTENQRYALLLGQCVENDPVHLPNFKCLDEVQTTSWFWHLYYLVTRPRARRCEVLRLQPWKPFGLESSWPLGSSSASC